MTVKNSKLKMQIWRNCNTVFVAIVISLSFFSACSDQSNSLQKNLLVVEEKKSSNNLFYTGIIKPLKTTVISSPADGVIVEMPFQYGQKIKRGQLLFLLSSIKFMADYKAALMQYIKAKSEFNTSQTQLTEAKFLFKNELISADEFKTKQASFYGNRLALLQAKDVLENLLLQLNIKDINLYKLTIADIDKINKAMHFKKNSENLRIIATTDGVILSPSKNDEENKKLLKGDAIKQGDVLAIIGDMNGISVQIKINELAVNQIKLGQPVKITGIAFPEHILQGSVTRIDKQAEISNTGMPTFTAEIKVPKLSEAERDEIHVGMSAKIELNIAEAAQMMVPIKAVIDKKGLTYLQIYDEKLKQEKEVIVKTGKTDTEFVAILSGLKKGDKVVIPN